MRAEAHLRTCLPQSVDLLAVTTPDGHSDGREWSSIEMHQSWTNTRCSQASVIVKVKCKSQPVKGTNFDEMYLKVKADAVKDAGTCEVFP